MSNLITGDNAQTIIFSLKYKSTPPPATGLVRVYHQIDQNFETFQSLIISPGMTTSDVIQLALARMTLDESHEMSCDQFELVQKTAEGGAYS